MSKEIFDATNPQYRCCCGCHVTTGAMIICLIYLVSDIIVMIQRIFLNNVHIIASLAIVFAVIGVIAFGAGFFGAKIKKPRWLIPAMIMVVCFVIYAIFDGTYGIYTFLATKTPQMLFFENYDKRKLIWPYDREENNTALVILFIVVRTLIGVAFHSWLLSVIYRCYQYLTAKNEAVNARPTYQSPNNV